MRIALGKWSNDTFGADVMDVMITEFTRLAALPYFFWC